MDQIKNLRAFLVASIMLMVYLLISMLLKLPTSFDFIVFLVVIAAAGLATISIKF